MDEVDCRLSLMVLYYLLILVRAVIPPIMQDRSMSEPYRAVHVQGLSTVTGPGVHSTFFQ